MTRSSPPSNGEPLSGAVLLGVGVLGLFVAALFKLGGWYDGWQQVAQLDPELAERTMLRSLRSALGLLSLAIGLVGTGVGVIGWRTMQARRFPPSSQRSASRTGDDAVALGRMLLGSAVFGTAAVVLATWLVGVGLGKRAVAEKMESVAASKRQLEPYEIRTQRPGSDGIKTQADVDVEDLRQSVLLHCMPEDRTLCSATIKAKLKRWLGGRLSDGATCEDLATELTVPVAGIQPWCGDLAKRLSPKSDDN